MKTKLLLGMVGALVLTAGCVGTVTGGHTGGVPFIRDRLEGRYKAPPEAIFAAAKEVMKDNGVLTNEGVSYADKKEMKVVQGRVNECTVWVSIVAVDAEVTSVFVQVRTTSGGTNMNVAHQIEKEIALRLAARTGGS
jgi:hypothetical protein